jgi:hypothetical protein
MTTPQRGLLFHFTHLDNLRQIALDGLCCDLLAQAGRLRTEVGNLDIKEARRKRAVPLAPGGMVADYVPFYLAARSPMLYVIWRGQVPTYQQGQEDLVYLVSSVDRIRAAGLPAVFTDRNASLGYASFHSDLAQIDEIIDWELMEARIWRDGPEGWDRKERRMAELLVHQIVPCGAIIGVGVIDAGRKALAELILKDLGLATPVRVRRDWYY